MQTDSNMETMSALNDVGPGTRVPLSPPNTNFMETFVNISEMFQNNPKTDDYLQTNTDDRLAYDLDDYESSVISPDSAYDNAVDPEMFLCHNNEHNHSTSSWASSPFGESDGLSSVSSPFSPLSPAPQATPLPSPASSVSSTQRVPDLARQMSLMRAMEVLEDCSGNGGTNLDLVISFPSPPHSLNEDDQYLQHPSPSYAQLASVHSRTRTYSDLLPSTVESNVFDTSRARVFSADANYQQAVDVSSFFLPFTNYASTDGNKEETATETQHTNDSSNENTQQSVETTLSCVETTSTITPAAESTIRGNAIHQLTSFQLPENSLDYFGMLDDFMASTDPEANAISTEEARNVAVKAIAAEHDYSASQETICTETTFNPSTTTHTTPAPTQPLAAPTTTIPTPVVIVHAPINPLNTPPEPVVVDLTQQASALPSSAVTVPDLVRTPSYKRRRAQNNKACRESRKKRKTERDIAESKVEELTIDNELMRQKIKELEIEVKEARALLIAQMTGKA